MENINDILGRYWEGETNLAEEQALNAYFKGDTIKEEHLNLKALFEFYNKERSIQDTSALNTDIDTILELYWEGKSSLVEELILKDYFAQGEVLVKHQEFAPLFDFLNVAPTIESTTKINTDIDTILELYWEGKSSLVEETMLKDYFAQGEVLAKHQEFAPLFDFFQEQEAINISLDRAQLIEASKAAPKAKVHKLKFGRRIMATAASLLLLAMVFFTVKDNVKPIVDDRPTVGIENPEEALAVTMEALSFLSKKLDHNTTQIKRNFKNVAAADILK